MAPVSPLLLLINAALRVGIAASDVATAERALAEAADSGASALRCDLEVGCVEDEACARAALDRCDVDALLFLDARREPDGPWVKSVVVDGRGAVVFSLEEPGGAAALSLPVRSSLASLAPRARPVAPPAPAPRAPPAPPLPAPPAPPPPASTPADRAVDAEPGALVWLGVGGVALGAAIGVAAVSVAAANELTRGSPISSGSDKVIAGEVARVAWLVAASGSTLLIGSAVIMALSWPGADDHAPR